MARETSTRRQFLGGTGIALATSMAGCNMFSDTSVSGDDGGPDPSPTRQSNQSPAESPYTAVYRAASPSVLMVQADRGQGTGFLYDESHVVTNAHVVGSATDVHLQFSDGSWRRATVEGSDVHSDLAVIRTETIPEQAAPLPFRQEPPAIGQEIVAIGNPFNLEGTVTTGIVSGRNRLIPAPSGYRIPDAIQTDAAVNPGNSGGPLMSLNSQVVGVVNSKRGDNIAFGISAALTQRIVPELIERRTFEHPYIGVSLDKVTPSLAEANNLAEPTGLLVLQTLRGGPADGILQGSEAEFVDGRQVPVGGDVILGIDGMSVHSLEDVASYLALHARPGDTVDLAVFRNGSEQTVELTLGTRPETSQSPLG